MKFEFFVARRYLFSRKSHHAINIISGISVVGVAVTTAALVCTLSVFNGFQDLIASLFTAFDPQLKVSLVQGKTVPVDDEKLLKLQQMEIVQEYSPVMEDQALVVREGRQIVVNVKGVSDNFRDLTDVDSLLYGEGEFLLHADSVEYGVLGIQLASQLGMGTYFEEPLQLYAPKKGERVNMGNPMSSFNHAELQSPGVVFMVQQSQYDANYILTSLSFAQHLFDQKGRISSVEIKLKEGVNLSKAKESIREVVGPSYSVQDRYEQQDDVFRIMRIEKLISYLFLTFILLVACFNIIGSLSMLMIEKKQDAITLGSLGADARQVGSVFMWEGRMINLAGACCGICLGLLLCWLQDTYGLITMGGSAGSFIVESYPVSVDIGDVILIFATVFIAGWAAVSYPVHYLCKHIL